MVCSHTLHSPPRTAPSDGLLSHTTFSPQDSSSPHHFRFSVFNSSSPVQHRSSVFVSSEALDTESINRKLQIWEGMGVGGYRFLPESGLEPATSRFQAYCHHHQPSPLSYNGRSPSPHPLHPQGKKKRLVYGFMVKKN